MCVSIEEPAKGYASLWLTWRCYTDSALDILAGKNISINGATSMETQPVHAGWPPKTQLTCYNVLTCHITAHWMSF